MAARRAGPPPRGAQATRRGRGASGSASAASLRRGSTRRDGSLAEIQRLRLLTAMAIACRRIGPGRVTVSDVIEQSRVSRRTFYEIFDDRDDCIAAALEEALRRAAEQVVPAYVAAGDWREAVHHGIDALLAFLDEDRTFGGLLVIDSLAAGQQALRRRAEVIGVLSEAIAKGRRDARPPRKVSPLAAEGAVGAVLSVLHSRMIASPDAPVSPLTDELSAVVICACEGVPPTGSRRLAAARRSVAKRSETVPAADADPLARIGVRLTYRTLLVLRVLASVNGAAEGMSNRDVADAAGISDQGQASKLLARLSRHGLIANERRSAHRDGEPNAWRLTERGTRVERAARRAGE